MAQIISTEGQRVYVATTYGEPAVTALKQLGAHWDRGRKLWWVGKAKLKALEDALVGSDKGQDEAAAKGEPPAKERPEDVRLVGKATYKGRTYYVRAVTQDRQRCRLVSLDQGVDFWAALGDGPGCAVIVKAYAPRQVWDGRRYSGRTVERHTTLRDIQRFVADQRDPATRRGECSECGAWGPAGESCSECGGEGSYQ